MEGQPAMAFYMPKQLPLTPESPFQPISLPHVCEPIPPLPMTPPDADEIFDTRSNEAALQTALHVIATERDGLTSLGKLYETNSTAQEGFMKAVSSIANTLHRGAKLVVTGVGKSGKIGEKVVATMNSFGIRSTFLHPTEALHGDLGMIAPNDIILLLTFSGRTAELLLLLGHIRTSTQLIAITSHTDPSTCSLFKNRPPSSCILLPAPIPTSETESFGLAAPTTSTTTALALSDALALAIARRLHVSPADVFHKYHPGGAIGAKVLNRGSRRMADLAVLVDTIPIAQKHDKSTSNYSSLTALDVLLTAARSTSGWVRPSSTTIISPRKIQLLGNDPSDIGRAIYLLDQGMIVEKPDWISLPATSTVEEVRQWIMTMREGERGKSFLKEGTVLGIVDEKGEVSGVVAIEDLGWAGEEGWGGCG